MLISPPPQLSGTGKLGHTVSLQSLHARGIRIMGHLNNFLDNEFIFASDAKENVRFSDNGSQMVKSLIDDFISRSGIDAPANDSDPADEPDTECVCADERSALNYVKSNITSVVWCTGFTGDFSWIKLPVLTPYGMPMHHNGISPVKGLYFIGMPWLRTRKSGVIYGITEDAEAITNEILTQVKLGDALMY